MSEATTVGRADLLALLGEWSHNQSSLYVELADALVACVRRGDLAPGTRLPAERDLARGISVSRGTVMAAYGRLRELGWAESRRGSGTRIRDDVRRPLAPADTRGPDAGRYRTLSSRLIRPSPDVIDLALALVRDPKDLPGDLFEVPQGLVRAIAGDTGIAPQGGLALREAISARYTASGLRTTADQIVVTGGGQQGIDLCATLALRPGDTVLVEEATYPGGLASFSRHGARIRTVPVQGSWGDLRLLTAAIAQHRPRLMYLMPSMHNPTGRTASESWRRALAALADQHELYLVEDDSAADLLFDGERMPPVAAYSASGRVLTIGSLSKPVWGGLRVGWLRANEGTANQCGQIKATKDLGLSAFAQAAAVQVLPRLDEIAAMRARALGRNAEHLVDLLELHLPDWEADYPDGGLTLWARLPEPTAEDFAQRALRHGVAVSPGAAYCAGADRTDRIRLSFASRPETLTEGVLRLAAAWKAADSAKPRASKPA